MASQRMITAATTEYRGAIAANDTERVATIEAWLEAAMVGESDRNCEWQSGWSPRVRRLGRATRQLMEGNG